MSILKTKPNNQYAIPSDNGWIDYRSGEVLVSLRGLKNMIAAEEAASVKQVVQPVAAPVVVEQVVKKPKKAQKIIAEVVEYKVSGDDVIGE